MSRKMVVILEKLRLIMYKKQARLPSPSRLPRVYGGQVSVALRKESLGLRRVKVYGGQDFKQAKRIL